MDWNELLSTVLQGVLIAVLPTLTAAFVRWAWAQADKVWDMIQAAQPTVAGVLDEVALFAVKAAEQAGAGDFTIEKKDYALDVAQRWLAAQGLRIDTDLVGAAIEKAVLEVFNTPPALTE